MLYDRIKEARTKAKMTQREVAEKIGVAVSTYSGYERGASDPDVNTLCKIMSILSVDANFIYQDYDWNNKEAPAGEQEHSEGVISLEQSNRLLAALGFIKDGEDLSDDDLAFLTSIISILDAWFTRKRK